MMDKVQMVLLKKSGIWDGEEPPVATTAADLEKYRSLYKQPLPRSFIAVVSAMLDAAGPVRKKGVDQKGQPWTVAV